MLGWVRRAEAGVETAKLGNDESSPRIVDDLLQVDDVRSFQHDESTYVAHSLCEVSLVQSIDVPGQEFQDSTAITTTATIRDGLSAGRGGGGGEGGGGKGGDFV